MAVLDYSNKEGERTPALSIGNSFDHFKWSGTLFQKLLSITSIGALWGRLLEIYSEFASPFMLDRGFPPEVSISGGGSAVEHNTSDLSVPSHPTNTDRQRVGYE